MANSRTSYVSRRAFLKGGAAVGTALAAPTFFVGKAHAATEKLSVGIIPAYSFGIYWLVQDQGFAPGVEMDFSVFPSGPPAIEAMVGGSVDAITVGSVPPLAAMARKVADVFEEFGPRPGYGALQGTDQCWVAVESFTPEAVLRQVTVAEGKPNEYRVSFVRTRLANGETAYLVTTREVKPAP